VLHVGVCRQVCQLIFVEALKQVVIPKKTERSALAQEAIVTVPIDPRADRKRHGSLIRT
jgi:hypothetical protein